MAYKIKQDLDMWYVVYWQMYRDSWCVPYALFPNAIDADDYAMHLNKEDFGQANWCCLGDWRWYPRLVGGF